MKKVNEVLVAVPESEYEHLKQCEEKLIALHEAEIQRLRNEMQGEFVKTIVNSAVNQ